MGARMISRARILIVAISVAISRLSAQEPTELAADRGPRFLAEVKGEAVPVEAGRVAVLTRRISVAFTNTTLEEALATVADRAHLPLLYSNAAVPLSRRVTFRAENVTVAAALTELLVETDVDVLFLRNGRAVL